MTKEEFIKLCPDDTRFIFNVFDIEFVVENLSEPKRYGRPVKGDFESAFRELVRSITYFITNEVGNEKRIEWNDKFIENLSDNEIVLATPLIAKRLVNKYNQNDNTDDNLLRVGKIIPVRGDYLDNTRVLVINRNSIKIQIQDFITNSDNILNTSYKIENPNNCIEYFIMQEDIKL